jgi:type VI secretion system secreted protein VgrG
VGRESYVVAGRKNVIEACTELTIKAGTGFIKIDPSGVYIGGTKIRVNSGGSPGKWGGREAAFAQWQRDDGERDGAPAHRRGC